MNKILNVIANYLFKYKLFFIFLSFTITIFSVFYINKLKFDFSVDKIFLKDDKAHEFYNQTYLKEFEHLGVPCFLAVSTKNKEIDLEKPLKNAFDFISEHKNVIEVVSFFNQPIIDIKNYEFNLITPLDEKERLTEQAKTYFLKNPSFKGIFVAKNDYAYAFSFFINPHANNNQLISDVKHKIEEWKKDYQEIDFIVTGAPFIQQEMISLLQKDQITFLPVVILLILILLLFMTKHILGALYPLIVIMFASLWTLGLLSFLGHEINVVNNSIIVLIIVIGIADSIHIYTRFKDESLKLVSQQSYSKEKAVINTIQNMILPCFLTTATTALGFFASSSAGVTIVQSFGNDAAIGVLLCFLSTFFLMPFLLYIHPTIYKNSFLKWQILPHSLKIENILRILVKYSLKYAFILVSSSFILFLLMIFYIKDIKSNQNLLSELKDTSKISLDTNFIENNFIGTVQFYVVFNGTSEVLNSYETFLSMNHLTLAIRNHHLKPFVNSLSDITNNIISLSGNNTKNNFYASKTFIDNYLRLTKKEDDYYSADHNYLRIEGSFKNTSTEEIESFRLFLEQEISKISIKGLKVDITGSGLISARALHNIIHDMAKSTMLAAILIILFIAIIFKSIRYSIIALVPNILPILITLSVLYFVNIDLRLATVMIFSMTLGLSIDNCLHILCRIEEEKKQNKNLSKNNLIKIIYRSFYGSGRAICYTTFILLGGFCVMAFSEFLALRDFAIIAGITLFSALLLDIMLFPALLLVSKKYFKR